MMIEKISEIIEQVIKVGTGDKGPTGDKGRTGDKGQQVIKVPKVKSQGQRVGN